MALPGVWRNRGKRAFISGEQGNKGLSFRGRKTILGNREHKKTFGGGNKSIYFRGTREQRFFRGTKTKLENMEHVRKHLEGGNMETRQFISAEQGNRYPLPWEGLYNGT